MDRLSSPLADIRDHYQVVVIGSGYGGAILASRLARAGQSVCILERGRELQPGEYPETQAEILAQAQLNLPDARLGPRTGLFDLHLNRELDVLVGCGLGGTSLINAGVALRPEPRVFDDPVWPEGLRADLNTVLEEGYGHATEMLQPVPYPPDFPSLDKLNALSKAAGALRLSFSRPPVAVAFADGPNIVGIEQQACRLCGDCATGCNYSAKNTLLMNYLPDAKAHGAEMFTGLEVREIRRSGHGWIIHFQAVDAGLEALESPKLFVSAGIVILAAGTLGSTEILLRSKAGGLPLSDRVGHRFSANGDLQAFAYNSAKPVNGVGYGHRDPSRGEPVGPCISGMIDRRFQPDLARGVAIQEGAVPGGLAALLPSILASTAGAAGDATHAGVADLVRRKSRELESLLGGPRHGAVRNTLTLLAMAHDDAAGRLTLEGDRIRVHWPGAARQPAYERAAAYLKQIAASLGATYVPNPIWTGLTDHNLVTVHPLGGCVMADDAAHGVVNHKGQVFSSAAGDAVYEGLYVCDGSIIPRPLGINPLLTISALAERCAALIARDHDWPLDYRLRAPEAANSGHRCGRLQPAPSSARPLGIQFTESFRGHFSTTCAQDYEAAAAQGEREHSPFELTITVRCEDLERMLSQPDHEARFAGTASAPALSRQPLAVTQGKFNLLMADPDSVEGRLIRYRGRLTSEEGATFFFDAFKRLRAGSLRDAWRDSTTVYLTVSDAPEASAPSTVPAPVRGRGILHASADDFKRQLTTVEILNAASSRERLQAMARFGEFLAGALYETYGSVFARQTVFNPAAPPRKKRPLRASAPQIHFLETGDGVTLRLTRYRGGSKGPVLLSHGLGVSSRIFTVDTIETNLVEYLVAHGFDTWLLDYRASIDLAASAGSFTGDEIAAWDYPAAVTAVRQHTGATSIQAVVHCFGATTFFMSMLAGLSGVRSIVCSQVATHLVTPVMTRLKCGLHIPDFLDRLGVRSLSAYVDARADWHEQLYDEALRLYPVAARERCADPVCHRISFLYSLLYEHAQLNAATHEVLHELFGVASVRCFEHVGLMVRSGHVVKASGADDYLPHLDRLALPIAFLHGAENECFLPPSTETAYHLLRERNGKNLYSRHVIAGYGHIDCIFGKNAVRDVYPHITRHLEAT